jgi:hypothetical protein
MTLVHEQTIPFERLPFVGEVSAKWLAQRIPMAVFSVSRPELLIFDPSSLNRTHEAEWTPFQTHYFSENLLAPGIERGTSGSVARNSGH